MKALKLYAKKIDGEWKIPKTIQRERGYYLASNYRSYTFIEFQYKCSD